MKVRYTRPALADLDDILDFIAARSPQGAQRVHRRIQGDHRAPGAPPSTGARTDDPTIRRVVISPYPYIVFYEVTKTDIIIHAIRHGARRLSSS